MALKPDIEELAAQDNALAEKQAASAMPAPVIIRVIDASGQMDSGMVYGELEGRTVRCVVPSYLDLRSADQDANGQVLYALPLKGRESSSEYIAICPVWNGTDGSRAPRLMTTQIQVVSADGSSSSTVTTDHGALTGLSDDDHSQYHNDARGDARYYTQAQVTTLLGGKADTSHTHTDADITNFAEAVDDRVNALLQEGTNITLTYNDGAGTLTIDAAGGGSGDDTLAYLGMFL